MKRWIALLLALILLLSGTGLAEEKASVPSDMLRQMTTEQKKETGEEIGLPATFSKTILTDILRGDMGFSGLIVADAMNMDAIARHFDVLDAAKLAIEAGVDLILRPVDPFTPDDMAALEQYVRDVAALAEKPAE